MRELDLLAPQAAHVRVEARTPAALPARFAQRLTAIAEALFAADTPADPERIEWTVADFCDFASRATGRAPLLFSLSIWTLTWIAPLFVWRLGPLGALDLELRARALERIEASFLGFAALSPKAILCMIWFEHDDTRRETRTEVTCLK